MDALSIYLNGTLVGRLARLSSNQLTFTYDSAWLSQPASRPISLSMPLMADTYEGDVVYNFFDNLLPDNTQIRARIQAKFHAKTSQAYDLLAEIGRDCVGAVELVSGESIFTKEIAFEPLSNHDIATILRDYQTAPLGMLRVDDDFRISIAGAQEKAGFLYHNGKWCRPLGATPTSHIFKLPIGRLQHVGLDLSESCENEWLCTQILKAFGLPVADADILFFEDVKVLSVKRFDRAYSSDQSWLVRLPQEDFCQALGYSPNLKYESDGGPGIKESMALLRYSSESLSDQATFFKSQIVFYLLAAIDGHAKNFSIFIDSGGRYRMTPLYDVMSAYPLMAARQLETKKIKMAMGLMGKNKHYHWSTIQRRHFVSTARAIDFSEKQAAAILAETLSSVDSVVDQVSALLPANFPQTIADTVLTQMRKIAKC